MRNISFMLTTAQIRARTKDVTRRVGWRKARVGERLQACEKCQGLRPGESLVRICVIELVCVSREPLRWLTDVPGYGFEEVRREGFAEHPVLGWPSEWVEWFCNTHRGAGRPTPETFITRLEFKYV